MFPNEPFYRCPKYSRCSVNACPLDPKYPGYTNEKDPEQECKLSSNERAKISNMFPNVLRLSGLTELEAQTSK